MDDHSKEDTKDELKQALEEIMDNMDIEVDMTQEVSDTVELTTDATHSEPPKEPSEELPSEPPKEPSKELPSEPPKEPEKLSNELTKELPTEPAKEPEELSKDNSKEPSTKLPKDDACDNEKLGKALETAVAAAKAHPRFNEYAAFIISEVGDEFGAEYEFGENDPEEELIGFNTWLKTEVARLVPSGRRCRCDCLRGRRGTRRH